MQRIEPVIEKNPAILLFPIFGYNILPIMLQKMMFKLYTNLIWVEMYQNIRLFC